MSFFSFHNNKQHFLIDYRGNSMSDLLSWNRPDSRFSTHTLLKGVDFDCLFWEVDVECLQNIAVMILLNKLNA